MRQIEEILLWILAHMKIGDGGQLAATVQNIRNAFMLTDTRGLELPS